MFMYSYIETAGAENTESIMCASALYSQFCFYDWIPRFCPRFPHLENHRALGEKVPVLFTINS